MGKIAFLFPSQGAQYPGMGKALAACSPAAAEVFRKADALRPGASAQCFSGTEAELHETKTTQPCLFAVELAAAAALAEAGLTPEMAVGRLRHRRGRRRPGAGGIRARQGPGREDLR